MKKINLPSLKEHYYYFKHESGLDVYLMPKKDYHKTYATLSTNFGSTNEYMMNAENEIIEIPQGVAHFLEHKLFEQSNMDISEAFAMDQASVNAFTSNQGTTYLFSSTDHVLRNTKRLLEFVLNPAFTEQGIQKEIPIISEEIMMYQDSHHTRMYLSTLNNLYHHHPVKNDILGTVESISKLNVSLLEDIHNAYYHPSQMMLFVIGQFTLDDMEQTINDTLKPMTFTKRLKPYRKDFQEPENVKEASKKLTMDILMPDMLVGIKLKPSINGIKEELIYTMILQEFFSQSSDFYQSLLEENIINDSYGYDITLNQSYGNIIIGSETVHPKELAKKIIEYAKSISVKTIDEKSINRMKRQLTGNFVQSLNHLEYIANQFVKYRFFDEDIFRFLPIIDDITAEDIKEHLIYFAREDIYTEVIVYPKKKMT